MSARAFDQEPAGRRRVTFAVDDIPVAGELAEVWLRNLARDLRADENLNARSLENVLLYVADQIQHAAEAADPVSAERDRIRRAIDARCRRVGHTGWGVCTACHVLAEELLRPTSHLELAVGSDGP